MLGSGHVVDITLKFFNPDQPSLQGNKPDLIAAAKNMSALWAEFARSGTPSAPNVPDWPAYRTDRRATMMIGANCEVVLDPFSSERMFWQKDNSASHS